MFATVWSWMLPLLGAAAVFAGVLLSTPPGFQAVADVVIASPRGQSADAAAYALGSAATLALLALVLLAVVCGGLELALRRLR